MAARARRGRQAAVDRAEVAHHKNKVTWIQGRGTLDGPRKVRVDQAGEDGTPGGGGERVLNATDVILATGSRVKSLPGLELDGKRIVTSDDVLGSTRFRRTS